MQRFNDITRSFKISDLVRSAVPDSIQRTRIVWHADGVKFCLAPLLLGSETVGAGLPPFRWLFSLGKRRRGQGQYSGYGKNQNQDSSLYCKFPIPANARA